MAVNVNNEQDILVSRSLVAALSGSHAIRLLPAGEVLVDAVIRHDGISVQHTAKDGECVVFISTTVRSATHEGSPLQQGQQQGTS